jgi:hypothetical protein
VAEELGRRVACSLHYQHLRILRLLQAAQAKRPGRRFGMETVRENFASSNWASDWDEVMLKHPVSGLLIGLLQHQGLVIVQICL